MNDGNAVIIIPARWKSSRFPGKPLHMIEGKSLIKRVWEKCCIAVGAANVYVATDHRKIGSHCNKNNMQVIMTSEDCLTGTDRVAEAYKKLDKEYDIVINVQGDEPLVDPKDILEVAKGCNSNFGNICCGYCKSTDDPLYKNTVKVVFDENRFLLYASRAPIPMNKNGESKEVYKQVCIYAFIPFDLERFQRKTKGKLEEIEDIELLRILEKGDLIQMVEVGEGSIAVDSKEDADKVSNLIRSGKSE